MTWEEVVRKDLALYLSTDIWPSSGTEKTGCI